ncbi:hypothetical protein JMJ35_007542 [Cladonia borealis]|uniref:Uncharacterized protein n=1 Tax=Cladonia borealis TaxID=184061 RepID=A0AA39UZN8_9LECA|nr:hypothetical protein JMJ35_007542 [Cladonia borealis]
MPHSNGSSHQSSSGSGSGSQANNNHSASTYQTLNRTWPTEANPHGQTERQQTRPTGNSPAMQRWAAETMREQPWNGVGYFRAFATGPSGQTGGSNGSKAGAEAGSEYRH